MRDKRGRRFSGPWWLVAGLIVGIVAAPAAAVAATLSVVSLAGPNGSRAVVTKGGQVLTVPASPESARVFHLYGLSSSSGCDKVYTAPHGVSLILTQVNFDVYSDPTPGTSNFVSVSTASNCANIFDESNAANVGASIFTFDPGIVIPAGKSIYAEIGGNVSSDFIGYGYVEPVADAPQLTMSTPVWSNAGAIHATLPGGRR